MSGGFRDTFTKEDKEGLLGYDDTAFYYFAGSVLLCIAVPWTFNFVYNTIFPSKGENSTPGKNQAGSKYKFCKTAEMQKKQGGLQSGLSSRFSGSGACVWFTKVIVIALMWCTLVYICTSISEAKDIASFDPFAILEVAHGADAKDIKKAYRKLSLVYHPDKNPDDPLAASRFIQITKAYAALTDETAKKNYEKYGNPDGPQTTKVGIGLPRFLLEKNNQLMILSAFFFVLLFVVPMTFICYYQRTKNYAANGVMIETLQFLAAKINETTRVKNCPELLGASAESRGMQLRPSDNTDMKPVAQEVVEHKKKVYQQPVIVKNTYLIWAHMQRLHNKMTPELREDCDQLLKYSVKITQAMIEIACMRELFFTAQAMIEFRRSLVQALDVKASQLLQIPHFNEEILKHCHRGKNAVSTLPDFIAKDPEQRKGLSGMEPQQLADVEAFCAHVTNPEVKAWVEVEDEGEVVVGDVATVTVQMLRKNLQEGEAMGPVHAPFFPEPKFEEWWLFLVEATPSVRIITFERIRSTERFVEEKLRFHVSRPGKHSLVVHMVCDSYVGIDQKVELNFNVMQEEEVKREVFVHPEDEELDLQPTLFQQFMGELNREDESEEEEDEDKRRPKVKSQAANLSDQKGGDKDDREEEGDKKDDKDDESDSSDSSSDSE